MCPFSPRCLFTGCRNRCVPGTPLPVQELLALVAPVMRDDDVDRISVHAVLAEDAPQEILASMLTECYSNYQTYDYVFQTRSHLYQGSILSILFREISLPTLLANSNGGVWLLAVDGNGKAVSGLFMNLRSFSTTPISTPAATLGNKWGAIWQAEHKACPTPQRRRWLSAIRIHAFTVLLACAIGPWSLRRLLRYSSHGKELNRRFATCCTPTNAMWRIDHVFTMPHHRGRGICRQLFEAACEAADEGGATLYLSTSAALTNVPMYRRFGFEIVGAVTTDGTYMDASLAESTIEAMSRDSARTSAPSAHTACPQLLLTTGMARPPRSGEGLDAATRAAAGPDARLLQSQQRQAGPECSRVWHWVWHPPQRLVMSLTIAIATASVVRRAHALA